MNDRDLGRGFREATEEGHAKFRRTVVTVIIVLIILMILCTSDTVIGGVLKNGIA